MRFDLVDQVLDVSDDRIVTIKCVSGAEEYLADHFPTFPVLPGVMMLEAMVQAGRRLVERGRGEGEAKLVLGRVRALKYGRFVRPGETLRVEVALVKRLEDDTYDLKGQVGIAGEPDAVAASGRLTLRPVSVG